MRPALRDVMWLYDDSEGLPVTVPCHKPEAVTVAQYPVTLADPKQEMGLGEYLDWCRDENSRLYYGSEDNG